MFATQRASAAYASANTAVRSPRSTEFELLAQITARMQKAQSGGAHFAALAEALADNRRLWTRLATDVASKDNNLPSTLRAQIFYLAEFTFEHSASVLRGEASCDALIDINKAIMRGLKGQETEK